MGELRHIAEVIEDIQPLEVDLYVCDVCLNIGKLPMYQGRLRSYCTGPAGEQHKRASMKLRTFREVVTE